MTAAARLRERLAGQPIIGVHGVALTSCAAVRAAEHDVVLILTAHAGYDWPTIVAEAPLVVDTRNATADVSDGGRVIRL